VGEIGDPPGLSGPPPADAGEPDTGEPADAGRGDEENPPADGNESADEDEDEDDEVGADDESCDEEVGADESWDEEPGTAGSNVVSSVDPGLTLAAPRAPDRRGPITRAARLKTLRVPFSYPSRYAASRSWPVCRRWWMRPAA
jgi:hypothetical protein